MRRITIIVLAGMLFGAFKSSCSLQSIDEFLESSSPLYKLTKFTLNKFGQSPENLSESKLQESAEPQLNPELQNKLMIAINKNNSGDVEKAIALGARVNARSVFGKAPIHWAALLSETGILNTLLRHGADVNTKDRSGRTPLHWAAGRGYAQVIKALLTYGAKVNVKDDEGLIPLDYAEDNETRNVLLEAQEGLS